MADLKIDLQWHRHPDSFADVFCATAVLRSLGLDVDDHDQFDIIIEEMIEQLTAGGYYIETILEPISQGGFEELVHLFPWYLRAMSSMGSHSNWEAWIVATGKPGSSDAHAIAIHNDGRLVDTELSAGWARPVYAAYKISRH
jgi:hypothetical protein